jgi:hypothetical protein
MRFRPLHRPPRLLPGSESGALVGGEARRLTELSDRLVSRLAIRPLAAAAGLAGLSLTLSALFAAAGQLAGDDALFFRELAPGTWLSLAGLLLIASIAAAIHRREGVGLRWHQTFWGLCAAIFLVFAFDEITQSAIYLSHLLERFGLTAASGFHDLEAVLLTLGFLAAGLVLLPRAAVLRHHPLALGLLALAALIGAASQGLDSFARTTPTEFVAEETLKLLAEAVFAGGFLVALRDSEARRAR